MEEGAPRNAGLRRFELLFPPQPQNTGWEPTRGGADATRASGADASMPALPLRVDESTTSQHTSQHTSQRKSAQQDRRRSELLHTDHEEGAIARAIDGLCAASIESAKALARICSDKDLRDACVEHGALAALCQAFDAAQPASVALQCCIAVRALCMGSAEQQECFVAAGGLHGLVSCLEAPEGVKVSAMLAAASCRALEHVATGVGAAARREAAFDAGAFPALVALMSHWREDEGTMIACRAALRSLTRDSPTLQDAARSAGAETAWLL